MNSLDDIRQPNAVSDRCAFCDQKATAVLRWVVNETSTPGSGGKPGKTVLSTRRKACDAHAVAITHQITAILEGDRDA